jgi:hypothetical protein
MKHVGMTKTKKGDTKKMKAQSSAQVRATIGFPPELYESLQGIAKKKKVSLAWVIRDAAEGYVALEPKEGRGT